MGTDTNPDTLPKGARVRFVPAEHDHRKPGDGVVVSSNRDHAVVKFDAFLRQMRTGDEWAEEVVVPLDRLQIFPDAD